MGGKIANLYPPTIEFLNKAIGESPAITHDG